MIQNNFNGGIISPVMYGRVDQQKYQSGLAECKNFLALPHGAVDYRNGFEYVAHDLGQNKKQRIIPFVFSNEQAVAVIFSPPFIYFSVLGKMLLNSVGTELYKINCPYPENDLQGLRYAQSGDVITITHRNHAPRLLKRLGAANWSIEPLALGYGLASPSNVVATANNTNTEANQKSDSKYVVTAVKDKLESGKSAIVTANNDLTVRPNNNTITWDAVTGAERYRVYKLQSGLFGYIGETDQLTLTDDYIEADTFRTPPLMRNPFAGGNPVAVSYVQQRKIYGGGTNTPQLINLSRATTEDEFSYSVPSLDDDAIQIKIAGRDGNGIQHIVPMNDLMIFTQASVWKMPNNSAITIDTVGVYFQANTGSNECTPLFTDATCIFSSDQTGKIHELGMSANKNGAYNTIDLSLFCPHLTDGFDIVDQAITRNPYTMAFFVRDDGVLIGMTYDPVQSIYAFHEHHTDGLVESVAVIPEEQQSCVYLSVKRGDKRYIERFKLRKPKEPQYENHLDCSVVFEVDTPTNIFDGLDWLNGKDVKVLVDGSVFNEEAKPLVFDGRLTLPYEAKVVVVGLPYEGYIETLPLFDAASKTFNPLSPKNIKNVHIRVYRSGSIFVSQSYLEIEKSLAEKRFISKETEIRARSDENYDSPPMLRTGIATTSIFSTPEKDLQIRVAQKNPLPLQIQAIVIDYQGETVVKK